jgi:hypothetical protein
VKRLSSTSFRGLLLPVLFFFSICGQSQYYSLGTDPAGIRWNQTQISGFNLIYPAKERVMASRYGGILDNLVVPVTASMQAKIRTLPVILHPYAAYSNGSSILAPRRIELFPKQPIALETNDFESQLLIHEVRHFAQMERLNSGVTKIAGYLLGEQAQSIVIGIHVPVWLLEGDAVLTETLLSSGGRGRIAGFIQPLRSRLIENKDLSWDRVWFGTYNESMPNEYLFGYFLTARGRMLADPLLWSDALEKIGRNPFNINGLSGLTRPKKGYRFSKLYVETLEWLYDFWTNPALMVKSPDSLINITINSKDYFNYFRPQKFSNHEAICLKRSMGDLPAFVIIDSLKNERTVARPGTIEDAGFSYNNGKLIWAELIQDSRWENRSWSDLYVFNFKTLRKARLTHAQKFFSPVYSPDGSSIAVIEERPDGSSHVKILDAANGRSIKSVSETRKDHFSFICWGSGPEELFAITTGSKGRKLVRITFRDNKQEIILDAGYKDISSPAVSGAWIYFTGPAGATQGLYRIGRTSHVLEMVFAHPHGINYLTTQGPELFMSVYSDNGYRPATIPLSSLHGKRIKQIEPLVEPVTAIIERASGEFPIPASDTLKSLEVKPYSKFAHLLRLHSWSPLFINPDSYQINPGVVLMSQNELSTLTCWTGYQYNKPDLSHNFLASVRYTGFYPTIEMSFNRKYRNPITMEGFTPGETGNFPAAFWQFFHLSSGIPLNFSSGAWTKRIQPALFFEQVSFLADRQSEYNNSAWMAGFSVSASFLRKYSYRDLFPKWGISSNFSYFKAFGTSKRGNNLTGRILLYVPGLLPNSSLRILNSASLLTFDQFMNALQDFPRGQVVYQVRNTYNLKIDYALPLAYPDYHLSWLIYINRVKADLFFDAGTSIYHRNWFVSTGTDLTIDYHLFRLGIALESGIRVMFFPGIGRFGAEFLFSFAVK